MLPGPVHGARGDGLDLWTSRTAVPLGPLGARHVPAAAFSRLGPWERDGAGPRVVRDPAPVAGPPGAACSRQARAERRTWSSQARRAVSAASASAIRLSSPAERAVSRSFSSSAMESSS